MARKIGTIAIAIGGALGLRRFLGPGTPGGRRLRAARSRAVVRLRMAAHRSQGARYRLTGRHPAAGVDDKTLADRIRSTIGPVQKRLGLPRVHVMVENGTALLHGEVRSQSD